MADAECTTGLQSDDAEWKTHRFQETRNGIPYDYEDLTVGRDWIDWQPVYDSNSDGCADDAKHTYEAIWSPSSPSPVLFKIFDVAYKEMDNFGALCMKVYKLDSKGEIAHLLSENPHA